MNNKATGKRKWWSKKKPPYQVGIDGFTNIDKKEKEDKDGWIPASFCLPLLCDLVHVRTAEEKARFAWWNGKKWEGYRLKEEEVVMYWKNRREEH